MVKSEESKVYTQWEPLWRILRYEQSEFGEGETNVSAKWARLWSLQVQDTRGLLHRDAKRNIVNHRATPASLPI